MSNIKVVIIFITLAQFPFLKRKINKEEILNPWVKIYKKELRNSLKTRERIRRPEKR